MMGLGDRMSRAKRAVRLALKAVRTRERGSLLSKFRARMMVNQLAAKYGIYLSPVATIGPGLVFPHPVGIVIGDGVRMAATSPFTRMSRSAAAARTCQIIR